jgi:hypothetical protein
MVQCKSTIGPLGLILGWSKCVHPPIGVDHGPQESRAKMTEIDERYPTYSC